MIYDYLEGIWRGDGYYFIIDADKNSSFNIPWLSGSGKYYEIKDGVYINGGMECFEFNIISRKVMEVYSYKDGRIYRLTRE